MNMKKASVVAGSALAVSSAASALLCLDRGFFSDCHPQRTPRKGQTRIACVGDSITYGCGVKHWTKRAYPAVLSRLMGNRYCVNNFGYSARTASLTGDHPYESEKLYQKSLSFQPDIVVLMLGTNDSKPYNWRGSAVYTEDCRRLIRAYRELPSDPQILLMTPPPAWGLNGKKVLYEIDAERIEHEIHPALIALADEEGLPLIDAWAVFQTRRELFWDGVHPNADGARLFAETVYQAIRRYEL